MKENSNDVIRFRVTENERQRIQALADKRTNGNMSSLIKSLVFRAVRDYEESQIEKVTKYELRSGTAEVKTYSMEEHGYAADDPEPKVIAEFRTKEEALEALKAYRCTARHYEGFYNMPYWFITEYWIEENVYAVEEDGELEWHEGGEIWEWAEWQEED